MLSRKSARLRHIIHVHSNSAATPKIHYYHFDNHYTESDNFDLNSSSSRKKRACAKRLWVENHWHRISNDIKFEIRCSWTETFRRAPIFQRFFHWSTMTVLSAMPQMNEHRMINVLAYCKQKFRFIHSHDPVGFSRPICSPSAWRDFFPVAILALWRHTWHTQFSVIDHNEKS